MIYRFRAITSSYYRGALGALLVYDVTRVATFENVKKWLRELREFGNSDMVIILVGNKCDLGHSREVQEEEGRLLAESEALFFMETSAMENVNVEEVFLQMVRRIHEIASQKALDLPKQIEKLAAFPNGKEIISIHDVTPTKPDSYCCSI